MAATVPEITGYKKMAIQYSTAVKNSRMLEVVAAIDGGGGVGKLEIGTAGMATILSTIPLNATCGTVAAGTLTFSGFPKTDTNTANGGTAAAARIRAYNNVDIITGLTVGTSSSDVIIDETEILIGQKLTVTLASITHR